MALITIQPSPLSKKFTNIADGGMQKYTEVEVNGRKEFRSLGEFKQERLPGSSQREMPIAFSGSKRRFLIKDYDNNSEELNALVKKCNFINDMPKHPEYGRLITSCDIFNQMDPFFNNKKLHILLSEGAGILNTDIPVDLILYKGALVNPKFQIGGDKINPALSGRAKYIIVDRSIDVTVKRNARALKKEATDIVDSMTDDKKLTVALAMGLIKSEDTDIETVTDILYEAAEDTKGYSETGLSKQEYLIKIAKSDADDLATRKIINVAFSKGFVKRDKETTNYVLFGNQIGKDKQAATNYLLNPINNEMLFKLKQAIDLSKTAE